MKTSRAISDPRLWISSFGVATMLAVAVAAQTWLNYVGKDRPASFLDGRFLQPQLIRWYVWALLTPALVVVLERIYRSGKDAAWWRLAGTYVVLGAAAIMIQAVATGFALGWWWSFPSLIPTDPQWHIAHELRSRTVLGALVFAVIVLTFRLRQGTGLVQAIPTPTAPEPPPPVLPVQVPNEPAIARTPQPIALRTRDRVVFVEPEQIEWVEADRDHVVVHVKGAAHRIREPMSAFEARLPSDRLIRVSRSAIVNIGAVAEMQPWFRGNYVVILRSGARIPTGQKYRERITRLL